VRRGYCGRPGSADTDWHRTGARKRLVRQACDANRQPLKFISNGTPALFQEDWNEIDSLEHIYETGFDEKLLGFSTREARFVQGQLQDVTHKRSDGTTLESVRVIIKSVIPQQPKAAELRAGAQFLAANDTPVISAYHWIFAGNFPGGSIDVLRDGQHVRIEGFEPGSVGFVLEDHAP